MGLEARPAVRAAAAQPDAADRRELTYAHNVGAGAESLQLVAVAAAAPVFKPAFVERAPSTPLSPAAVAATANQAANEQTQRL